MTRILRGYVGIIPSIKLPDVFANGTWIEPNETTLGTTNDVPYAGGIKKPIAYSSVNRYPFFITDETFTYFFDSDTLINSHFTTLGTRMLLLILVDENFIFLELSI